MLQFLCFRCSQISTSIEGPRCPNCDGDGSGTVTPARYDSAVPEYGNASPGYYVTVEDASTQVSEEDLVPVKPTQEASTQVSEEDLEPVEPTREASTQTSDEDSDFPLQIIGSHGYENFTGSNSTFQNETAHDFHQYNNENQNYLKANSNANEGEFYNQSYDICNASTLQESTNDRHLISQQQVYLAEQSLIGKCNYKYDSDKLLRRQGTIESADPVNSIGKLDFTGSVTYEVEYPILNNFSETSDNAEGRQKKGDVPPSFSSLRRRHQSIGRCFQENFVTVSEKKPKTVEEQKLHTSYKRSKKICEKCGRHFFKELTFYAHMQYNCNPRKPYKCSECDEIFSYMSNLLSHRMVHTGEKPFKCTLCGYASKWPYDLKKHLKKHTKK